MSLQEKLKKDIAALLRDDYDLDGADWGFSLPAERKFGDLSTTLAFALAKKAKGKPFLLAGEIAARLQGRLAEVEEIRVAGGGFLNFFLRRDDFVLRLRRNLAERRRSRRGAEKVIVEHTNINPNKAAHIGHLRNACLGDTLARCCVQGLEVEVQNYIDDTGVQVVDVVCGSWSTGKRTWPRSWRIPDAPPITAGTCTPGQPAFADDEPGRPAPRSAQEDRGQGRARVRGLPAMSPQHPARPIRTMDRIGIRYDLLPSESNIIALDFLETAVTLLKRRRASSPHDRPGKEGCWVMKLEGKRTRRSSSAPTAPSPTWARTSPTSCGSSACWSRISITSPSSWTPTAPFGSPLGRSRGRIPRISAAGRGSSTSSTPASPTCRTCRPRAAGRSVIRGPGREVHPLFLRDGRPLPGLRAELGLQMEAGEESKPFIEVSGRKGRAVKADDLLDHAGGKIAARGRCAQPRLRRGGRRSLGPRYRRGRPALFHGQVQPQYA